LNAIVRAQFQSRIHRLLQRVATITSRIRTTIENAERERDKYAAKAKVSGLALNVAIGLQVLLGSLTTGLSGVAISSGKSVSA